MRTGPCSTHRCSVAPNEIHRFFTLVAQVLRNAMMSIATYSPCPSFSGLLAVFESSSSAIHSCHSSGRGFQFRRNAHNRETQKPDCAQICAIVQTGM